MKQLTLLGPAEHPRDSAELTYIYPVVSRRAGGVSIGVNLNTNRACNWRCIYCQVPELVRGAAPPADIEQLGRELEAFIDEIVHGDFMLARVPEGARRLVDIAFSGDGEPSGCANFAEAVDAVVAVMRRKELAATVRLRLITNGSLMSRQAVQRGIAAIGAAGGEVWFKLDAATTRGMRLINDVRRTPAQALRDLQRCTALCDTWIQTCMFRLDGQAPSDDDLAAYGELVKGAAAAGVKGVLLYGIARASRQPEAPRLAALGEAEMAAIAARIEGCGLKVAISP